MLRKSHFNRAAALLSQSRPSSILQHILRVLQTPKYCYVLQSVQQPFQANVPHGSHRYEDSTAEKPRLHCLTATNESGHGRSMTCTSAAMGTYCHEQGDQTCSTRCV